MRKHKFGLFHPKTFRRFLQGVLSVTKQLGLFGRKFGYYIPYAYADRVSDNVSYPLKWLKERMENSLGEFSMLIDKSKKHSDILKKFERGSKYAPHSPRYNQDWFSGLDATMAYTLVRDLRPSKIIEVGGGHSTYFLAQAVRDDNFECEFHCVNPKSIKKIKNICTFHKKLLDRADLKLFENLKAGDIIFIDGSHQFLKGTDLELLFLEVFPYLPKRVYIHFHDVFLPNNYPEDENWNWWNFNEQNFLATLLSGGDKFEIVLPNFFIKKYAPQLSENIYAPCHKTAMESSFWIKSN
jgi:Methyltransferase domain